MQNLIFYETDILRVVSAVMSNHDLRYTCGADYTKSRCNAGWWMRGVRVAVTYNGAPVATYALDNASDFQKSIQLFEDMLMLRASGTSHTGLPAGVP